MLSGITAATLAIVGGLVLDRVGVTALALGSAVLVLTPAAWLASRHRAAPRPPLVTAPERM